MIDAIRDLTSSCIKGAGELTHALYSPTPLISATGKQPSGPGTEICVELARLETIETH